MGTVGNEERPKDVDRDGGKRRSSEINGPSWNAHNGRKRVCAPRHRERCKRCARLDHFALGLGAGRVALLTGRVYRFDDSEITAAAAAS
jgi:hypothetical protein